MKHLKLYEEVNEDKPKVGDYILLQHSFLDTTKIYKIIKIEHHDVSSVITIENLKDSMTHIIFNNRIVFFSSNIEDCEAYLAANKYNL